MKNYTITLYNTGSKWLIFCVGENDLKLKQPNYIFGFVSSYQIKVWVIMYLGKPKRYLNLRLNQ